MSELRQELADAVADLERQRTPLDREALKSRREQLDRLALRLKDVLDQPTRAELDQLHDRAVALFNSAWHDALYPTALSGPERATPEEPGPPDRPEPWRWSGFDR